MIADLQQVGLTATQLQPLFGSAQAYITMWTNAQPPPTPPAITSTNATTFTVGAAGSFTVTATGLPVPTISEKGALPGVVTLSSNGTLSGTPATGSGGVYQITIDATNGVQPDATQPFTLTVDEAPSITSTNAVTFTTGVLGSFPVTASGYPAATFSETGSLPNNVNLNPTTGALSGTPAPGTGGSYPITITASNGVGTNATQPFTLTVDQPPAITSANTVTFTTGVSGSFPAMATGYPTPTFSYTGALPNGVQLNLTTGVLSGSPAAGTGGVYPITITASNGTLPNATQTFTLVVDQPPAITSVNGTTFTTGTTGSFTVVATGYPPPMFTEIGALPNNVTLNAATGVLGGPVAAGTGGTYPITITASNGVGTNATQTFTLIDDQPPAITSASAASFRVGVLGSFPVVATGFPAPTFSETGKLPMGVTINSTTGVLSGTPAAGTGGFYPITITASNGVLPNATQSFVLSVQDFSISATPATETISSGQDANYTLTVTPLGGLTGTVSLTCSGFPQNSTCTVNPSSVTLGSTAKVTITLFASKSVDHGTFPITFTGTQTNLIHQTTVSLTVK
jgi:hypothetical protein